MFRVLFIFFLGAFSFVSAAQAAPDPALVEGQVWSYQTRPHEPASRVLILHLYQAAGSERIAYVAVLGATIRLEGMTAPVDWARCALPITETALRASLRDLERARTEQVFPELEQKYLGWKRNADKGNIQFWTQPVRQVLDELEGRVRKAKSS